MNIDRSTRTIKKTILTTITAMIITVMIVIPVSATVFGNLTFYHGVNNFWKYTYGQTTSTATENSMQFFGLINYFSGPYSGETLLYESAIKYNTTSHIYKIYPGNVYASSYFLYFVDDICQHQSTAWWDFDFR